MVQNDKWLEAGGKACNPSPQGMSLEGHCLSFLVLGNCGDVVEHVILSVSCLLPGPDQSPEMLVTCCWVSVTLHLQHCRGHVCMQSYAWGTRVIMYTCGEVVVLEKWNWVTV